MSCAAFDQALAAHDAVDAALVVADAVDTDALFHAQRLVLAERRPALAVPTSCR